MRFRRHVPPPPLSSPRSRNLLRDAGIVAIVGIVGFVVAALWLSPVPVAGADHAVPRLVGLGLDPARRELDRLGLRTRVAAAEEHPSVPAGAVARQDPPPGVVLGRGGTVELVPSAGRAELPVPDLTGLDMALAERILVAAGFRVGTVDSVRDRLREPGIVIATRPAAGAGRSAGAPVDFIVNGARP